jgi:MutL protein
VRDLYLSDLVDRKGLAALAAVASGPIQPTPVVVGAGVAALVTDPLTRALAPGLADPLVVIDVGGATTDVFISPELRADSAARTGRSRVVRRVFTDLGVAASRERLLRRARHEQVVFDLIAALRPGGSRPLYCALAAGEAGVLRGAEAVLACVFLALRAVTDTTGPDAVHLDRALGFLVTGGAVLRDLAEDGGAARSSLIAGGGSIVEDEILGRVISAACRRTRSATVTVDTGYQLWAHGLRSADDRH